jgi:WhiB family redox-sensing transcriptional regulator
MEEAACRSSNPDVFYPARGESTEDAKAICQQCPVRQECLDHAIEKRELQGVWGALSVRERRHEVQRRLREARLNAIIGSDRLPDHAGQASARP